MLFIYISITQLSITYFPSNHLYTTHEHIKTKLDTYPTHDSNSGLIELERKGETSPPFFRKDLYFIVLERNFSTTHFAPLFEIYESAETYNPIRQIAEID